MSKRLLKVVALSVCLGFALLIVPGLNSAEKKTSRLSVQTLLKQPGLLLSSLLPWLELRIGRASTPSSGTSSAPGIVKPTGDSSIGRPSGGN